MIRKAATTRIGASTRPSCFRRCRSRPPVKMMQPSPCRQFAAASSRDTEWRKQELNKLEQKFQQQNQQSPQPQPLEITSDEDLQPMWKEMESRVTRRRTLTKEQAGGKTGRKNIKKTDEEAWLQAGLYDKETTNEDDDDDASN